ncbi:MAG TPA: tetratricopeptide repeat protein [Acidimicrobiia bacterium]|nr:tetratricopeptide repeat protein [Acidimicrobiia bacterium]
MADHQELETALALGESLMEAERYQEAIDHFSLLAAQHPGNQYIMLHLAGAYDSAGHADEAIAPYRAALAAGLNESEDLRARIQLASTLRNVGEHEEAVQILTQVCTENPQHRAARAFLALALTSAGHGERGVSELLDLMLTNPGPLEAYHRSLRWYADDLRAD